jgi:hypothetical protein
MDQVTHLIIDGQQRIRSIHDALSGLATDTTGEDDVAGDEVQAVRRPVWCLNLVRLPEPPWAGRTVTCTCSGWVAIPITSLPLPEPRPEGVEWIDAYRHWLGE